MQNVFLKKIREKYIITLDYRDATTGKRKQKQLKSFNKNEKRKAEAYLVEIKVKLNNSDFIMPEKTTVETYLLDWIEKHKNNISITTYNRYKDIITRHVVPALGQIELQKLSPLAVETFYSNMLNTLSHKTVLQYHRMLHKAFDKAYKMQIINKNTCDLVDAPKPKKFKATIYDQKEVKQLLQAVKNTRLEAPVNLALACGLRAGEILALSWDDIDSGKNIISINKTLVKDKVNKTIVFKEPKSESSNRVISAPIELIRILDRCKKAQLELTLKSYGAYKNEHNLIFTKINGEPMTSDTFSRLFRDFLISKNLPLIRFHDLRHTNASLMLASGTASKVASSRLGHSSIGITLDLYTHVLQELEQDSAERLNKIIYG